MERAAAAGRSVPDVELVVQTSDGAQSTVGEQWLWDDAGPLFGSIKCGDDASVSFPMNFHDNFGSRASGAMSLRMYDENTALLAELDSGTPAWADKRPQFFFSAGNQSGKGDPKKRGYRSRLFELNSPLAKVRTHP